MRTSLLLFPLCLMACGSVVEVASSGGSTSGASSTGSGGAGQGGSNPAASSSSSTSSSGGSGGSSACCETNDNCPQLDCNDCFTVCVAGVCKLEIEFSGACWTDAACGGGAKCAGALVCPCGNDCDEADHPGVCVPPADPCAAPIGAACDAASFPQCPMVPVSGVPCCWTAKVCEGGALSWGSVVCTDDCAQDCQLIGDASQCSAVGWCAWYGSEPPCVGPGGPPPLVGCDSVLPQACVVSLDCPSGQVCKAFTINPCAGQVCDECAMTVSYCAPP